MLTLELLTNLFQSKLGNQYKVCANDAFDRQFTTPSVTPYGAQYDVNHQAFEEYADKIVAVLTVAPTSLYNLPYKFFQGSYALSFWVPVDYVKTDNDGRVLETPKFDFYADADALIAAINAVTSISDGGTTYKAFMTLSEPQLTSKVPEATGAYKRLIYTMTGNVSVSDSALGTGSNIKISFVSGGEKFITDFSNLAVESGENGNVISFDVDDLNTNDALTILQGIAFTRAANAKFQTKIYKNNNVIASVYASVKVQYIAPGRASFCRYHVTLTWAEDNPVSVSLTIGASVYVVNNITRFVTASGTDNNALLEQGTLAGKQEPAATGQRIEMEVDDYATSDAALELFRKKAFKNEAEKAYVTLSKKGTAQKSFWASLDVQYVIASGYGKYIVTLTDLGG